MLLDRFFGSRVAGILFGIAAVGVAILSQAHEISTAFLGAALIGLGMGAEADVMPYLVSRYFGLASFSEIYGYAFTAYALAGALGPLLMGWSFDRFHSYSAVLLCLAAAMFSGAAVLASLPRYPMLAVDEKPERPNGRGSVSGRGRGYFQDAARSSMVRNWFAGTLANFCFAPLGQVTSIEVTTGS